MSEYGESRSQDKRLAAQGKPKPPETSLTSRELAERFFNGYIELVRDYQPLMTPEQFIRPLTEAIDAWVRVREAIARLDQMRAPNCSNSKCPYCEHEQDSRAVILQDLESAIEQLKRGTHGQAEVPSAAASANSEPGGA